MLRMKLQGATALAFMVLALAGCGGGGNGGEPATTGATGSGSQVPASAQQSVGGLMAFLMELIAETSDTTEPVVLGDATLPTDDTSAPQPVN
jgi:hypothetical protein